MKNTLHMFAGKDIPVVAIAGGVLILDWEKFTEIVYIDPTEDKKAVLDAIGKSLVEVFRESFIEESRVKDAIAAHLNREFYPTIGIMEVKQEKETSFRGFIADDIPFENGEIDWVKLSKIIRFQNGVYIDDAKGIVDTALRIYKIGRSFLNSSLNIKEFIAKVLNDNFYPDMMAVIEKVETNQSNNKGEEKIMKHNTRKFKPEDIQFDTMFGGIDWTKTFHNLYIEPTVCMDLGDVCQSISAEVVFNRPTNETAMRELVVEILNNRFPMLTVKVDEKELFIKEGKDESNTRPLELDDIVVIKTIMGHAVMWEPVLNKVVLPEGLEKRTFLNELNNIVDRLKISPTATEKQAQEIISHRINERFPHLQLKKETPDLPLKGRVINAYSKVDPKKKEWKGYLVKALEDFQTHMNLARQPKVAETLKEDPMKQKWEETLMEASEIISKKIKQVQDLKGGDGLKIGEFPKDESYIDLSAKLTEELTKSIVEDPEAKYIALEIAKAFKEQYPEVAQYCIPETLNDLLNEEQEKQEGLKSGELLFGKPGHVISPIDLLLHGHQHAGYTEEDDKDKYVPEPVISETDMPVLAKLVDEFGFSFKDAKELIEKQSIDIYHVVDLIGEAVDRARTDERQVVMKEIEEHYVPVKG